MMKLVASIPYLNKIIKYMDYMTHLFSFANISQFSTEISNYWYIKIHRKNGILSKNKLSLFLCQRPGGIFFPMCGRAMRITMFIYIKLQISRMISDNIILRRNPLSQSFIFTLFYCILRMRKCYDCFLVFFFISMTRTQTDVQIKLSSAIDYLNYCQEVENVVCYKNKVFITHSLQFSLTKDLKVIS